MGRLVFAVPSKVRRAESLRPAGRQPGSLGPWLAAGNAPTGAKPTTFDLSSGPYGWHGTGRITLRSIAGAARPASAKRPCRGGKNPKGQPQEGHYWPTDQARIALALHNVLAVSREPTGNLRPCLRLPLSPSSDRFCGNDDTRSLALGCRLDPSPHVGARVAKFRKERFCGLQVVHIMAARRSALVFTYKGWPYLLHQVSQASAEGA